MDRTNLKAYIYEGEWYQIERYIENGGDVNLLDDGGMSLLHYAVAGDQVGIVKMLLRNGAAINQQDNEGITPLHYAVEKYVENHGDQQQDDDEAMIKLLVRKGADIYRKDSQDQSPYTIIKDYEEDHEKYELTEWMEKARVNTRPQQEVLSQNIPSGSSNTISYEDIQEGNTMVNFLNESKQGRYYKKDTYNQLVTNHTIGKKRNPYTRVPIEEVTTYKAHLVGGKRKTRKGKKTTTRKAKKTRKH